MSDARVIYHAMRRIGCFRLKSVKVANVHHAINERAELEAATLGKVENGLIGKVRDGMDCDCSQYHYEFSVEYRGLFAMARDEESYRSGLDGTESTWFLRPSEIDHKRNGSRDLALEAFEDGHSHVVYRGSL